MFQFISQIHCGLPLIWNSLLCPWISLMWNLIKRYFVQWLYWPFRPPLVQTFAEKEDVTAAYLIQPPIFSQPDGRQHWIMDTGKSQTCKWKTEVSGAVPHSDHHGAAQCWLRQKRIDDNDVQYWWRGWGWGRGWGWACCFCSCRRLTWSCNHCFSFLLTADYLGFI